MDYKEKYEQAIKRAKAMIKVANNQEETYNSVITIFPELAESEDERIRKALMKFMERFPYDRLENDGVKVKDILAWLEKQVHVDEDEIVKGIRRGVAISLMNHIDANSKGMCLSNMECEDIEDAIVNEDWDKVYGYMKKKLEKQGEKKSIDDLTPQEAMDIAVAKCFKEGEQNPAWSEEDENRFNNLIFLVECSDENEPTKKGFINFINRLKSLRPQNRWKPSDEQIEALLKLEEMHVLEHEKNQENAHLYMVVKSIREQLLKLREE